VTLRHRSTALLVVFAAALVAGACSSGGNGPRATLEIITTNIQSALGDGGFEPAEAGQELTIGDRVRTDDTGFAELTYHDGSWQRVENNATLTIAALTEQGSSKAVRTQVDVGRTWNRVRELTQPDDGYEVETPVATASVRGTIFATDCSSADVCTFRVIEGTVVIRTPDGREVVLTGPALLEVRRGEPLGEPQVIPPDVLRQDPWVQKNLGIDRERIRRDGEPGEGRDERGADRGRPSSDQVRTARLEGAYDGTRSGVATNYRPDHPDHVAVGSAVERTYFFAPDCADVPCRVTVAAGENGPGEPLTFDGTSYVQREELISDCLDDASRQPLAEDVARVVVEARWTPTDARRVDGEWVVTAVRAELRTTTEVLRPDQFGDQCYWPTTDSGPPTQQVSARATRR
jgi:LmbE family N-acetylglucosaminyl deacetylase